MPQPPSLTPEQRHAALEKAARARRERAEIKDHLKSGRVTLRELLVKAESDEIVGKMKVLAVLEALPGTGKVKARRLMEHVGISETRRLQGLGAKQREALLEAAARPCSSSSVAPAVSAKARSSTALSQPTSTSG